MPLNEEMKQVLEPAVNIYGGIYADDRQTHWVLYPDSDRGAITSAVLARGIVPEGGPHDGEEDHWIYGDDAWDFLRALGVRLGPPPSTNEPSQLGTIADKAAEWAAEVYVNLRSPDYTTTESWDSDSLAECAAWAARKALGLPAWEGEGDDEPSQVGTGEE